MEWWLILDGALTLSRLMYNARPTRLGVLKEVPMVQIVPEKKERNIAIGGAIGFILALVLIRVAGRLIK